MLWHDKLSSNETKQYKRAITACLSARHRYNKHFIGTWGKSLEYKAKCKKTLDVLYFDYTVKQERLKNLEKKLKAKVQYV